MEKVKSIDLSIRILIDRNFDVKMNVNSLKFGSKVYLETDESWNNDKCSVINDRTTSLLMDFIKPFERKYGSVLKPPHSMLFLTHFSPSSNDRPFVILYFISCDGSFGWHFIHNLRLFNLLHFRYIGNETKSILRAQINTK